MSNVRQVHEGSVMPDPLYAKEPLEWFVGRMIRMAFQSAGSRVEHMWVKVDGLDEDGHGLVGLLVSDPICVSHLAFGDEVRFDRTQIEAVDLSIDEWIAEVIELLEESSYSNQDLGRPTGPLFLAAYDEKLTPRQALQRWRDFTPRFGDAVEATIRSGRCD